jgi:hypothetical protein
LQNIPAIAKGFISFVDLLHVGLNQPGYNSLCPPRIAAILIIGFMSLFSLDVFETQPPPLELLGGFLIHNLPSIAMIVLLVFAWKRPVVGFVAFLIFGALFAIFFVRDFYALSNLLLFVLPILLIACLFYIDWKWLGVPPTQAAR